MPGAEPTWAVFGRGNCYLNRGAAFDIHRVDGRHFNPGLVASIDVCRQHCLRMSSCGAVTVRTSGRQIECWLRGPVDIRACEYSPRFATHVLQEPAHTLSTFAGRAFNLDEFELDAQCTAGHLGPTGALILPPRLSAPGANGTDWWVAPCCARACSSACGIAPDCLTAYPDSRGACCFRSLMEARLSSATSRVTDLFCRAAADVGCFVPVYTARQRAQSREVLLDGRPPSEWQRSDADGPWRRIDARPLGPALKGAVRLPHEVMGQVGTAAPAPARMRVVELVFVTLSERYGLGDSLAGLASAFWIAWSLGARLRVCWPKGSEGHNEVAAAMRAEYGCTRAHANDAAALKPEYFRRAYRYAKYDRDVAQTFVMRGRSFAFVTTDFAGMRANRRVWYRSHCRRDFARLRSRPRLYISTNRGILVQAYADNQSRLGAHLRKHFASAYDAAGFALRAVLTPLPRSPMACVHIRSALTLAPIGHILECALAAEQQREQQQQQQQQQHVQQRPGILDGTASGTPVAATAVAARATAGTTDGSGRVGVLGTPVRGMLGADLPASASSGGLRIFSDIGTAHLQQDRSGKNGHLPLSPFVLQRSSEAAAALTATLLRRGRAPNSQRGGSAAGGERQAASVTLHQIVKASREAQQAAAQMAQARREARRVSGAVPTAFSRSGSTNASFASATAAGSQGRPAPSPGTAWLELASCARFYIPSSTFSLSAAAASGADEVYAAPSRYITPFASCEEVLVSKHAWVADGEKGVLHAGSVFP